ncbi:calcium-binding protein [Roseovarius sp. MMSF_3281]|uniref:calcium-binding protein n=1 Tax=Roseovarius sp. MMSF_3281 TaxID=3046694 RepID=UPI00273FE4AE|nr:calcium-binding protein [Roseovarius sp. MMSF_3281]
MPGIFTYSSSLWAEQHNVLYGMRNLSLSQGEAGLVAHVVSGPNEGFQLSAWSIQGTPEPVDLAYIEGSAKAGLTPGFASGTTLAGDTFVFLPGTGPGGLSGVWTDTQGRFQSSFSTGAEGVTLQSLTVVEGASATFVYGLEQGSQSPSVWQMTTEGQLNLIAAGHRFSAINGIRTDGLTDISAIGPNLVAGGHGDAPILLFARGEDGTLQELARVEGDQNPGISGKITLDTITMDGQSYVIAGASGSSSISLWHITAEGDLALTDHVIDTRNSRFADVVDLAVVSHAGVAYLVAAGADDGISLFQILSNGRLIHLGQQADTPGLALSGIEAIDLASAGQQLVIAALATGEQGISIFQNTPEVRYSNQRIGTEGNDVLVAGSGGHAFFDGAGADTMQGGEGSDYFLLAADNTADTIQGFDPAQDVLDLSAWAFYRGWSQLSVNTRSDGAEIVFDGPMGREILYISSVDGSPLDPVEIQAAIANGPDRIIPEWQGLSDSGEAFDSTPKTMIGTPDDDSLQGAGGNDTLTGRAGSDRLDGSQGADRLDGGVGWDTLIGGAGNDVLLGRNGFDDLHGNAGDDWIIGNYGFDHGFGGPGNDTLEGGLGPDTLEGGEGADLILGSPGFDSLLGGPGADRLFGNAGADRIEGGIGNDTLNGGINFDTLIGGDGDDHLLGMDGYDTLLGGLGDDSLEGNAGNDWLDGGGDQDRLFGGIGADRFIFRGNGTTVIEDFQTGIDAIFFASELLEIQGMDLNEVKQQATEQNGDTVIDFGGGHILVLEGLDPSVLSLQDFGIL